MKYLQIIFPVVLLAILWMFGLSLLIVLYPHTFRLEVWDFTPLLFIYAIIFGIAIFHKHHK